MAPGCPEGRHPAVELKGTAINTEGLHATQAQASAPG